MTAQQRQKLEFLRGMVLRSEIKEVLLENTAFSKNFLKRYNVHLMPCDFENPNTRDIITINPPPPVLFAPSQFLRDHPIIIPDSDIARESMEFKDYDPSGRYSGPSSSCNYLAGYLLHWASGTLFPRKFPGPAGNLLQFHGVKRLSLPHPLCKDAAMDNVQNNGWDTRMYEYEKKADGTPYPHVMLLTTQYNKGENGSMMRGELAVILGAMHVRANQPLHENEEDSEDDDGYMEQEEESEKDTEAVQKEPEFLFSNERRFPVLVISCVAPRHARIYYASMNGDDLVIQQSQLFSFEKKNTEYLDFFSSYLLSRPIDESAVVLKAQPAAVPLSLRPMLSSNYLQPRNESDVVQPVKKRAASQPLDDGTRKDKGQGKAQPISKK